MTLQNPPLLSLPSPAESSESATASESHSPPTGSNSTSAPTPADSSSPTPRTQPSFSAPSPNPEHPPNVAVIPLNQIYSNIPDNGRISVDAHEVADLALNLQAIGQINPITVRQTPSGYELVAGGRRLRAARMAQWTHIAATIVTGDEHSDALKRAAENMQRSNLTPLEEANNLCALLEADPDAVDGVARMLGRSVDWILDRLDILTWPPYAQDYLQHKKLSLAVAKALLKIHDPDLREDRFHHAAAHGITAAQAALWAQDCNRQDDTNPTMSENAGFGSQTQIPQIPHTVCYLCQQTVRLDETVAARICTPCVTEVARRTGAAPDRPAIYHQGPPEPA